MNCLKPMIQYNDFSKILCLDCLQYGICKAHHVEDTRMCIHEFGLFTFKMELKIPKK